MLLVLLQLTTSGAAKEEQIRVLRAEVARLTDSLSESRSSLTRLQEERTQHAATLEKLQSEQQQAHASLSEVYIAAFVFVVAVIVLCILLFLHLGRV